MAKKRVTVYDIAEHLHISPSTVSRVLNKSTLISSERSKEILRVAKELGYTPRTVKKHASRAVLNIYLFLPPTESSITHFFYNISELIESIHEGFQGVRLNISTRINDGNLDFLGIKKTGHIDGCIFAFTTPSSSLVEALQKKEVPLVLLNRKSEELNCLYYDTHQGMSLVAEKVYHRWGNNIQPCYVGFSELRDLSYDRFLGTQEFFRGKGIPFDDSHTYEISQYEEISSTVLPWITKNKFNAVLAFNDYIAIGLYTALISRGFKIPEDISITGFDNSPLLTLLDKKIDTCSLSVYELGKQAGEWLYRVVVKKEIEVLHKKLSVEYISGDTLTVNSIKL